MTSRPNLRLPLALMGLVCTTAVGQEFHSAKLIQEMKRFSLIAGDSEYHKPAEMAIANSIAQTIEGEGKAIPARQDLLAYYFANARFAAVNGKLDKENLTAVAAILAPVSEDVRDCNLP